MEQDNIVTIYTDDIKIHTITEWNDIVGRPEMNDYYTRYQTDDKDRQVLNTVSELYASKSDLSNIPTEFKTINGESIVGTGDITVSGGSGDGSDLLNTPNTWTQQQVFQNNICLGGELQFTGQNIEQTDLCNGVMANFKATLASIDTAYMRQIEHGLQYNEIVIGTNRELVVERGAVKVNDVYINPSEYIKNDDTLLNINGTDYKKGDNVTIIGGGGDVDINALDTRYLQKNSLATINGQSIENGGDITVSGGGSSENCFTCKNGDGFSIQFVNQSEYDELYNNGNIDNTCLYIVC